MDVLSYEGYEIHAAPYQLADTGEWTTDIHIFRDHGSRMSGKQFSTANCFESREEAVAQCFNFGKRIIDGKSENLTVEDL